MNTRKAGEQEKPNSAVVQETGKQPQKYDACIYSQISYRYSSKIMRYFKWYTANICMHSPKEYEGSNT